MGLKILKGQKLLMLVLLASSISLFAQEENATKQEGISLGQLNKQAIFKPIVAIESWATYSMGETKGEDSYANRADVSLRRFRFGASGAPYSWLKYNFQFHFDRYGEDPFASTKGSYNGIGIWNAYLTAKLINNSDLLNLHIGYFWAAISREYQTSPWSVGSFDKTRSTWYLRSLVAGKGNGIESGIALGGIKNFEQFGISYRLGSYEPQAFENSKYATRLHSGRLMLSFGDPEQTSYKYMLSGNKWNKRIGVTFGVGGSTQSNGKLTDSTFFDKNQAYGGDVLLNYRRLQIDGEYFIMTRTVVEFENFEGVQWHVRAGYNFNLAGTILEPTITYEEYEGKGDAIVFKHIGTDKTFDVGVNWYLNKDKLKLALHYVFQEGSASPNKGDFIGVACQLKL